MVKKRSSCEFAVVFIIVCLSVALAVSLYAERSKIQKGNLLIQELSTLRSGIQIYRLTTGENPASLQALATSTYDVDSIKKPYLEDFPQDKSGNLVDPFGNPYIYDPKKAWVKSQTKGFENW
jgi:type II secretory pathway pseudopilin PulG